MLCDHLFYLPLQYYDIPNKFLIDYKYVSNGTSDDTIAISLSFNLIDDNQTQCDGGMYSVCFL